MTRTVLAALAALALLLTLGAASAAAAPPPKFTADLYASLTEEQNLEGGGYPDRCDTWTQGRGTLTYDVESNQSFTIGIVESPVDDSLFVLIPRQPAWSSDLRRFWKTRSHIGDNVEGCTPCGPLSEYGLCTGSLPDKLDSDQCGGPSKKRGGMLLLTATGRTLAVTGSPGGDLSRCKAPRDNALPGIVALPRFELRLPGAAQKLLRLKPGKSTTIRRETRRGACGRLRGPGLRTCSERLVILRVTRLR